MMRLWGRISFRAKLIASSIACILIPALLSLLISNYLTQDAVKEQAEDNAEQSLKLVEGYVSNLLNNMTYIANYIQVVDSDMRTILQKRAAVSSQPAAAEMDYEWFNDTKTIIDKIDNISIIGEEVLVTILLANQLYYANYSKDDVDPFQLYAAPWLAELDEIYGLESMWFSSSYEDGLAGDNEYYIHLGRTLRYANRNIYGYTLVTIREDQIRRIFERIAGSQEMMLLDEQNRIISHRDPKMLGERFEMTGSSQHPGEATRLLGERSEASLVSRLPVSAVAGWKLVSLMPYQEAISPINRIYNTVFVIQLLSFVAFLLLLIYLLQRFTRPLVRLGRLAETVQRGNLEVRSRIRGEDEIGRLGRSFDQMLDRIKEMIREVQVGERRKREAELAMLQAQINPHFLFNVLNSLRMKMLQRGDGESAEMISSMSRLMRMSIASRDDRITLHEEIGIVIDYVKLMNMRQREPIELSVQAANETFLEEVPRFMLQPIIENSIIHGFGQRAGHITIAARIAGRSLVITIEDDGVGMEFERLKELRARLAGKPGEAAEHHRLRLSGIGLQNVVERLRMIFGSSFVLNIDSTYGSGTTVELYIPRMGGAGIEVQGDHGG